jgi:hypothetical protein
MRPSFNIAGPCLPGEHYMVPPERRLGPALELIDEGKYFTLTAGRQTGKTTSLRWLLTHYREVGTAAAIWADLQVAREERDPAVAFDAILRSLDWSVETYLPGLDVPADRATYLASPATALERYLEDLLAQHTTATGQRFEPDAVARVFDLSGGHPWLVNALADQAVRREVPDRAAPITTAHAGKHIHLLGC